MIFLVFNVFLRTLKIITIFHLITILSLTVSCPFRNYPRMKKGKPTRQILHLRSNIEMPQPKPGNSQPIKLMLKRLHQQNQLTIGINSVNREFIQKKIKFLLFASDIDPPELIQHLLLMALTNKTPVLTTQITQKELGSTLGLRTACVIGIINDVQSDIFDVLSPFTSILTSESLPIIQIDNY